MPRRNTIEVVITGQDKGATKAVKSVNQALGDLDKQSNKSSASAQNLGAVIKNALGTALGFGLYNTITRVTHAITGFAESVIGSAADFEQYNIQFRVLMGNAEVAAERMEDIKDFARLTPFNVQDVIEATRTLMLFGGEALASGEALERVGDIAAGTGHGFSEVSLWVGRMVDELQRGGAAVGLSLLYLQRMGALTGEARAEMEKFLAVGDQRAAMEVFIKDTQRFGGMMEQLSGTFVGAKSNFEDAWYFLKSALGEGLLPALTDAFRQLSDALADPQIVAQVKELGRAIGDIVQSFVRHLPAIIAGVKGFFERELPRAVDNIRNFIERDLPGFFERIGRVFEDVGNFFTGLRNQAAIAARTLGDLGGAIVGAIGIAFVEIKGIVERFFVVTFPRFTGTFQLHWNQFWNVTIPNAVRSGMAGIMRDFQATLTSIGTELQRAGGPLWDLGQSFLDASQGIGTTLEQMDTDNENALKNMQAEWDNFNLNMDLVETAFENALNEERAALGRAALAVTDHVTSMIRDFFNLGDAAELNFGQRVVNALDKAQQAMLAFARDPRGAIRGVMDALMGRGGAAAGGGGAPAGGGGGMGGDLGDLLAQMGRTAQEMESLASLQLKALGLVDPSGMLEKQAEALQRALQEEQLAQLLRENPQLAGFVQQIRGDLERARQEQAIKELQRQQLELAQAQVSQLNDQLQLINLMDPEGKLTDLRDTFERQLRAAQINELLASNNSLQALQVQIQQELLRVNQEEAALQRQQAAALTQALRPRPAPSISPFSALSSRRRAGVTTGSDGGWVTGGGEPVPAYILNVHSMARTEDVEADFELLRAKAGRR